MSKPIRYTFSQIARREGADCVTTFTTTQVNRYIDVKDYDSLLAAAREAEKALAGLIYRAEEHAGLPGTTDLSAELEGFSKPVLARLREHLAGTTKPTKEG